MQEYLLDIYFELKNDFRFIKATYDLLNMTSEHKIPTHSAGQWLLDNLYIIEREYNLAKNELSTVSDLDLPNVKPYGEKQHLRILFMAKEIVEKNAGVINDGIVSNYIREFQKHSYITYAELSYLPIMIRVALIKFIRRLCINIFNSEMQKLKAEKRCNSQFSRKYDKIASKSLSKLGKMKAELVNEHNIKTSNTAYIEYMAYRLKDMGALGDRYLEELKEETNKVGFTIDEAIEKEHKEIAKVTGLIANSIISMKTVASTNWGEVLINVNRIDEMMLQDYTNEYKRCDHKTKGRYREKIIFLAKKYKVSEMYIAKKVVECSTKYEKHVGHFLIGDDQALLIKALGKSTIGLTIKNKVIKPNMPLFHVILSLGIATLATFVLDLLLTRNYVTIIRILLDILLFAYGMEIADKLITYIVGKIVTPKPLPRFNFAKTINEENSTLIAMPTVINSLEKIDKMIKKMEITYLANRSNNMYYLLLGDCLAKDTKVVDMDQKIVDYGNKLIAKLNEKYPSEPKLFNFIYRKRVYSTGEQCFMGWERKRGALTQLNSLLLGKLTEQQIEDAMYITHRDLPKVKYVLTIDEDTALSLNSAKELVAIISHPLNKPVLSKNGKVVKSGYGLIQPAVGLDIEAANSSIFSKVFGGFGGLDIYTNAISNLYQDLFQEAIYTGKGIYDIELFDKLIGDKVPENLILSHDLLEGSFLRTGLASDVEVQDGFPSNFIAYMKRNHRWFRGDMQIASWIFKPKSGLGILSRWKIFDNLRRELLPVSALIFLIASLFLPNEAFTKALIATFITLNLGYILSVFNEIIFGKNAERKQKQYIPVIFGIRANLLKMVENIVTIPYKSWVVLNAFVTSLYRMFITKKKLLEWATAETVEKSAKDKLSYVYKNMWSNVLVALLLIVASVILELNTTNNILILITGAFMFIAPYAAFIMSKKVIFDGYTKLDKEDKKELLEIGNRTWKFFDSFMNETNNYLPPDNFQENRRPKLVNRTSSTNIGYGLLSIINAYDLDYIPLEAAIDKLDKTLTTVNLLEKWHGHLYNWYNIVTLQPLRPRFVSTVDSGNFIACIYVVNEFLNNLLDTQVVIDSLKEKMLRLREICLTFMKETDFSLLYVKSKNIFSIGFDVEASKLVDSYYDMLMSESRLTSLIAIAVSDVTSKHWFALSRNLVKVDGMKGLLSWSGTSFEYFMPNLFTKTYKYTLIDEALAFAINSQIKYAKSVGVPWGVSESAFAVQDNEQNYQYKAFGIPWLGLKRGLNDNMVVSPYSSLMCLNYSPRKVFSNIKALKKYNSYSTYGFYEAIDFTKMHIGKNKKYEVVKTYMAHHQGMILTAINNYLNGEVIKNRFHANPNIDAADILLKERVPLSVALKESRTSKENKYIEPVREEFTSFVSYTTSESSKEAKECNIGIHTNGKLSTLLLPNGKNYMYFNNEAVTKNRYIDSETFGNNVFFTDRTTGKIWSATYEPNFSEPEHYTMATSLATTKYMRKDGQIETTMEVSIAPEYNMEIRKITLLNTAQERREIVINTELELAMAPEASNIVHPAFNSLLIEEDYDEELKALIATKRSRSNNSNNADFYVYTKLVGIDLDYEVETEKINITQNDGKDAFNGVTVKYPLWPVMAYRARIFLDPQEAQTFYYIVGATNKKYDISHAIVNADKATLDAQIAFADQKENILAKYLKLKEGKAEVYNSIVAKTLLGLENTAKDASFWDKKYSQSMLWKFGISGDLPIITVHIGRIEDSSMVKEVINFMDYIKSRKIDLDIVLIVDEELYSGEPIKTHIESILSKVAYMSYTRGNIYVVNIKALSAEENKLFEFISRYEIDDIAMLKPKSTQDKSESKEE
ncbi:MAG: hypothetical protein IKV94_01435 [Clostridia bacterium]|nr:hypothetical protein [Clostridia bacterium]